MESEEDKYCDNGDLLYAWSASFGPQIWDGGITSDFGAQERMVERVKCPDWRILERISADFYLLCCTLRSLEVWETEKKTISYKSWEQYFYGNIVVESFDKKQYLG